MLMGSLSFLPGLDKMLEKRLALVEYHLTNVTAVAASLLESVKGESQQESLR